MRTVVFADAVSLAVHQRGAGAPVALLHAWGETHRSFDRLVELLPAGTATNPPPATASRMPRLNRRQLDGLGPPAAWVVGCSSGGYVARSLNEPEAADVSVGSRS